MNKYFFISGNVVCCCIKNRPGGAVVSSSCDLELLPGVEVGGDPGATGSSPPTAELCLTLVHHMKPK